MHTSLMVHHVGCHLYTQDGILPFVKSTEEDLAKVRERHACNKDIGGAHSYTLLVANYGGIMAVPTGPPYCLVYPIMYNAGAEDQTHFNTVANPSGMCTCVCMCCSLLQLMDKDPRNRRTFEGSRLIVPHGTQYQSLFLEITTPCNHQGPLIDPNTWEPYPMTAVGDFCLKDIFFPGSPRDSLFFNSSTSQLTGRRNPCLPPPQKINTSFPTSRRTCRVPPAKRGNHTRPVAGPRGLLHSRSLTP